MNARNTYIYGNLALAVEPAHAEEKPRFTVIEGRTRCAMPVATPVRATARYAAVAATAIVAVLFLVVGLAGWSVFSGRAAAHTATLENTAFEEVRVDAGDSLWTLAAAHPIEGFTTQETSDAIAEVNGLDGAVLEVGEEILVPAER